MTKLRPESQVDQRYYEVATPDSLAERIAIRARDQIFHDFLRLARPTATETLLDVGISDVIGPAANVIERCYQHPAQITAVGLGVATLFQAEYPNVRYQQIEANKPLPFANGRFDVATSNAVLEHVGSPANQRFFVSELCRVAHRVFITVPHRYFPVEHHTNIPLLHWFDNSFNLVCGALGKAKWAKPDNLIMMSRARLAASCPPKASRQIGFTGIRLGPCSSNLYCYLPGSGGKTA